jgi:flagellar basal-body rod protein FlgC
MQFFKTMMIAAAGMRAQSKRIRIVSENVANASTTALRAGEDPYRRQIPTFKSELNKELGVNTVRMVGTIADSAKFGLKYDPQHPAADDRGYIKTPNVNPLIEMVDMRDAQRNFEANLNVIKSSRAMLTRTIDLLRR